ncbi:putative GntR-family transcriptional regulator [Actinoplanes missouriensis 431]|uniref:Putative GntR-family transcriptional regulator n=1 Tax=Actinoplanes missouriensis (strain ATCC 14538 / DSM 43046 / CBS 188.64 / JCM 3121 / NBRC 102363 / NCIMB 12654 / NRRL B-3342 / UNCC 431) TaxID=512565 RepID=I0GXU9_ACTM4|nr:GntR family transcriptional regulator [Actinoplanes missouriensis]BAL85586.1 putative GntR-family transcriptional regulator [Actinoplanes missouriensis 431]
MADRVPAYRRIATDLAEKIRDGVYRPGDALPAQRELSASYGVTLMTLRQALQELRDQGLIVQQAGRGTYVTPAHAAYRVDTLRSFVEDLREQGHEVTTVVLSLENGVLERLRLLDGQPAIHQTSRIAVPLAPEVDFRIVSLYSALAEAGAVIARASERIVPGLLPEDVAGFLERPAGSPVFVSERTTVGLDERILVEDRAIILGDLMEIRAERAATRLSLQWGSSVDLG